MQTNTRNQNTLLILAAIAIGVVQGFSVLQTNNLLAKPSSSRTPNTNTGNVASAIIKRRISDSHMMMIIQSEKDVSTENNEYNSSTRSMNPSNTKDTTSTSLAANYIIYTKNGESKYEPTVWTLVPLEKESQELDHDCTTAKKYIGEGTIAINALQSSMNSNDNDHAIKITCTFVKQCEGEDDSIRVTVVKNSSTSTADTQGQETQDDELIATLSRVIIQKKAKDFGILTSSVAVSLPTKMRTMTSETFLAQDIVSFPPSNDRDNHGSYSTCSPNLYNSLLPSNIDISTIEMSDMVDSSGNILGAVPRLLVHKFNILHRGIGIVVCDKEHIIKKQKGASDIDRVDIDTNANIYCHRRTDTKRIFPSLYDMFVGGVSMSGENEKLTAAREVAEELGLGKALNYIESPSSFDVTTSPLSDPLFKCTICTSYNRCIVTLFTYKYVSNDETIRWQEEEVSWGNLVPYHIVEKAATMSINRLIQDGKWPGVSDDIDLGQLDEDSIHLSESQAEYDCDENFNTDSHWKKWDFVPDGLLVWVSWLQWLQKQ